MTTIDTTTTQPDAQPRKKKRVFMWFFIAVQAIFVAWLIIGMATIHTGADPAEVARACGNGGWRVLFQSHQDCMVHYANGLQQAGDAGKAIGAGLVIALWVATDFILGVSRLVVLFARKARS